MTALSLSVLPKDAARAHAMALLVAVPVAYALLSLYLGQDANWDLRNYHWYAGYALIEGRHGFDMVPAQTPSFYNPLLDAPLYWIASALPAWAAMGLLSLLHGLNFVLLFALAHELLELDRPIGRVWASAGVALAGVLGASALALLGTTFWDNLLSVPVLAGLLVVVRARDALFHGPPGRAFALAALAGLPVGAAMGAKLPFVIYCVGACFAFLALPLPPVRRLMLAFFLGLGILAGIALTAGYWMWFLWETYGNPLHPYFNDLFRSPDAALSSYRDSHFTDLSPTLADRLLLPFRMIADPYLVGEIPWRDLRVPLLYLALPLAGLAALAGRTAARPLGDRLGARYLLWAMALAGGLWLAMFCIYRYLTTLEMLAPLGIVLALGLLPLRRTTRGLAASALLAVALVATVPGDWGRVGWSRRLVEVAVPDIPDPANTMVLMGGYQPTSFVIPAFPPGIPFVRIQSNFIHPDSWDNGYIRRLRARVAAHRGDFFMLSTVPDTDIAAEAAAAYGLRLDPEACETVTSNLNEPLNFCRVHRQGD